MYIKNIASIIILVASMLGALSVSAFAQGETGAQFLEIGVGAKASAMGEAFTVLADGPGAIYWNPAGMVQSGSIEIMASQNFWLLDMTSQFGGLTFPTGFGVFGVGITYSSTGDIPKYEDFQFVDNYSAYDLAGMFSFAKQFSDRFSIGTTVKLVRQAIEDESAGGIATDLGVLYRMDNAGKFKTGFSIQNLGNSIKFLEKEDPLPFKIRGGASYQMGVFTFAGDIVKLKDDDVSFNGGAEFMLSNILALRGGYNSANSYSAGAGINWGKIDFSYSYVPYDDVGDSQRISLGIRF